MKNHDSSLPRLRVCYFGTYREEYSRNRIMIEGLRRVGVQVNEVHSQLWYGIEDRVQAASGGWVSPKFLFRTIKVYIGLLKKYFSSDDYDIMVVGYPGQFDIFLARILAWLRGKPLCWDILMSIYLVTLERQLDQKSRLTTEIIRIVERWACHLPDLMILESEEYVDWFCQIHHLKPDRFRLVPLGTLDKPHPGREEHPVLNQGKFSVLYWGNFLRSHGVDLMVQAAVQLENVKKIEFRFIGVGPERERVEEIAKNSKNISFPGYLDDKSLSHELDQADLCLGVFGHTPQSMMTIQNRLYESLARGLPLLTGYSPLVDRTFQHGKDLFLCDRSISGIIDAVIFLEGNPQIRNELGQNGRKTFTEKFSVEKIGERFQEHLLEVV